MGPDAQLRLLWAALLCAGPLIVSYRLARRFGPPLEAAADALLLTYLVQYLAVGIPGISGFLTPAGITVMAVLLTALLWLAARPGPSIQTDKSFPPLQQLGILACSLFVIGYVGEYVYYERLLPPTATDALAYHLPAAVQWLQQRRIGLFQTWFFNPANTYSPLAGSIWAAWLLAPMGSDVLARLVELGPMLLLFLSILQLCLECGVRGAVAAVLAGAAVISRPFYSESIVAKDDLFVAAFFAAALVGISQRRLRQAVGPARLGVALGLLLATKYTALMSLPLLVIAADAPIRAGWRLRQWGVMLGCIALLAGPWYLRNCILVGNPIFPEAVNLGLVHLHGLFVATRSLSLTTLGGLRHVVCDGYYSMPRIVCVWLALLWLVALVRTIRILLVDPWRRCIVLGPPIGLAIFFFFSPYGEVRFIFPVFVLLFASCGLALRGTWVIESVGLPLLVAALVTSFVERASTQIVDFSRGAVELAAIGVGLWWLGQKLTKLRSPAQLLVGTGALIAILLAWSFWSDFVDDYRQSCKDIWALTYDGQGELWVSVQKVIPPTAAVAYANQPMVYPLYGFDLSRRVMYAPVRENESIATLAMPPRLSGEQISAAASSAANHPVNPAIWRQNLQATGAQFLIVGAGGDGPETAMARSDPEHFHPIFQNNAGIIFRITLARPPRD